MGETLGNNSRDDSVSNVLRSRGKWASTLDINSYPHAGPEVGGGGGRGSGSTPKNKKIGFLSNTDPDPLKITKLPSQHSKLGQAQW